MASADEPEDNDSNHKKALSESNISPFPEGSLQTQIGEQGVSVPDHVLSGIAARNSQKSQSHSITTAALWGFLVPICLIVLVEFYPITTRFITLDIHSGNFTSNGIGIIVQPGSAPNKRTLFIENETRDDLSGFIVNFDFGSASFREIVLPEPPGEFVEVTTVGRRTAGDGSFQSALEVKNLRAGSKIRIGLIFGDSADGFAFSSISGNNLTRWEGLKRFLTYKNNWLYLVVGALIVVVLFYKLVKPYIVNTRVARRVAEYVEGYLESTRVDETTASPIGCSLDDVVGKIQEIDDSARSRRGKKPDQNLAAFLKAYGLVTTETLEVPFKNGGFQRVMIGPFNILGHPTYGRSWWFRKLPFLVFQIGDDGKISAWNHLTVERLLNPSGDMIKLNNE